MYAFGFAACFGCGRPFAFNPVRVPSMPAHLTKTGEKEPICQSCVERANVLRKERGLPPIVPLPDAYDACEEGELG